jgi:hypothetical protein
MEGLRVDERTPLQRMGDPRRASGEKPAPATKWHLQVNTWGDQQVYFNVYKEGGQR